MAQFFTPAFFKFLRELDANNNKAWFDANRDRYLEQVREPFRAFLRALNPALSAQISPYYQTDDRVNGGSMFRIFRDARYRRGRPPYKTWVGARVWHRDGGKRGSPHFYVHLEPRRVFVGAGIWRPDPPLLRRIREFLHHNPNTWLKLRAQLDYPWGGETLVRMPRGFDADDPVADDIRRKDYWVNDAMRQSDATGADFDHKVIAHWQSMAPLVDYLCAALDLEF